MAGDIVPAPDGKYLVFTHDEYGVHLHVRAGEDWNSVNDAAETEFPNQVLWIEGNRFAVQNELRAALTKLESPKEI